MVFSSAIFLFWFLPMVFVLYYCIPTKLGKNVILTIASIVFYAFGQLSYTPLLLLSVLCNYFFGLLLMQVEKHRKGIVMSAAVFHILLLCIFKYLDFFLYNINQCFHLAIPLTKIPLPIGISFFTFQGLSYVVDVYRDRELGSKSFLKVLLYISFFPQLIAGPIVKYRDIAQQIDNRYCNIPLVAQGIRRFVVGLSKKLLIADTLARVVDQIYGLDAGSLDIRLAWMAAVCYLFQIYFDFSGYSDMALGLGRMFGFHFKENFRYPYCADSIKDFWRRWHISLSSWFRDYLYIPLGGNRKGKLRTGINKLIVFFATGLWHGANWTFVLWGLWHGLFAVLEDIKVVPEKWKGHILCHVYTIFVVILGFVLFRSANLHQAMEMFSKMFTGIQFTPEKTAIVRNLCNGFYMTILAIALIASMEVVPWFQKKLLIGKTTQWVMEGATYVAVLLLMIFNILCLSSTTFHPFIYFQF